MKQMKLRLILSCCVLSLMGVPAFAQFLPGAPSGNGIQPTVEIGNPNCCDLGLGSCGFKVDGQPPNGTTIYTIEVGSQNGIPTEINCGTVAACASSGDAVTITTSDGKTFDWTASPGVIVKAVIVKGGEPSNIYNYGAGSNSDTGLHTAINPNNQQFFDISHIDFCYELVDCAAPSITCPADVNVECDQSTDPANTGEPTATSACGPVTFSFTDVVTPGSCPDQFTITRTWTATDSKQQTSQCVQTIEVVDTTAPVLICPDDVTIECSEPTDPSNTGTATATDNCDGNPTITFDDVVTAGNCPQEQTIFRTWTATDACGNASTCLQTINVVDTTPPVLNGVPANITLQCGQIVPDPPTVTATDNCDPSPTVSFSETTTPGNLPGEETITRTWTATDACGNTSSETQTITVECPPEPPVKDCVLLADGKIYIIGINPSKGNICSNGEIVFGKGASKSELQGNVTAGEEITVKKHNTIQGTASAPEINNSGEIDNIQIGPVAPFSLPSLSFSAGGAKVKLDKGEEETLPPGSYGKVKLAQGAELKLFHNGITGEYFFSKFKSGKDNTLIVDVSKGPVTINIVGKVTLGKAFEVDIIGGGTTQFTINTLAKKVKIAQGSEFLGSLVAPKAKVSISKLVGIKGSICAKSIVLKNNATVLPHGSPHSLPKAFLAEDQTSPVEPESEAIPTEFLLGQNYPNPFNPSTTILFAVPKAGDITLAIYNLRGQLVRTLLSGPISAGHHRMVWDGRNQHGDRVASGVYIYQLQAKDVLLNRKLTLTK